MYCWPVCNKITRRRSALRPGSHRDIASKVRREQYDVDSKLVREYFNYDASRDGILTLVQDLFDVQIVPWQTDTWHEDVETYELRDGDKTIGRFYLDMHPRDGKFQHAAMFPFVNGIEGKQLPVAGLICNFPDGSEPMQYSAGCYVSSRIWSLDSLDVLRASGVEQHQRYQYRMGLCRSAFTDAAGVGLGL